MKAKRDVKKGEVIENMDDIKLFSPSPLKKPKENLFFGIDFCRTCGCALQTFPGGGDKRMEAMHQFLPEISKSHKVGDWLYCSTKCTNAADEIFNVESNTRRFFGNMKEMDVDDLALFVTISIYQKLLKGKIDPNTYAKCYTFDDSNDEMHDRLRECWAVLRSGTAISNELPNYSNLLNASTFGNIYNYIRQNSMHEIEVMHPLVHYMEKGLLKMSDENLKRQLDLLSTYFPDVKSPIENIVASTSQKVLRWRSAVRISQAVSKDGIVDHELSSILDPKTRTSIQRLRRKYFVYCPKIYAQHSCVPNTFIEGHVSETGVSQVQITLVALHDLRTGQQLTVSRIDDLSADFNGRQSQLKSLYGKEFVCACIRCKCECRWENRSAFKVHDKYSEMDSPDKDVFHWIEIKNMADLAMQNSNFKDAYELYTLALNVKPNDGNMLHARCASVLEQGLLHQAHEMWREAYERCPEHEGIMLHNKKQDAYVQEINNIAMSPEKLSLSCDSFTTLIPSKCFVTTSECPILSSDECRMAINWAEAEAKARTDGWTTSRHYAVPTTDIPVHEIPPLLDWFNQVLRDRLRPLLSLQFGEDEVGKNGAHVLIHDAFIVRYDATGGQRHLPLHRDQSTHSFTIALNSTSDYDGGGTFVPVLEQAIRPSKGGAMSFRGDQLLHGGDPVIRGRRYIIVAFCYVSRDDTNLSSPKLKKIKLDTVFHKKTDNKDMSKVTGGGFSFGFQI